MSSLHVRQGFDFDDAVKSEPVGVERRMVRTTDAGEIVSLSGMRALR